MGSDAKDGKGVSRRDLLTFWRRPLEEIARKPPPAPLPSPAMRRPPPLRPPGMLHEALLVNHCTRCNKCVEACPADAIAPLGADWGTLAGTPAIDARKQPCVLCNGLACTHVCPSDALLPLFAARDVSMGSARVDEARCLAHLGVGCDRCVTACPMPGALALDGARKLVVDRHVCVGCGLCEHVCPTEPAAIRVIPRD